MEHGVVNITRHSEVMATLMGVVRTTNGIERMKGLLGTKTLKSDQGMWLTACNSIHTFFMHYDLDILYIDRDQKICRLVPTVKPWRANGCLRAKSVLEIASGEIDRLHLAVGDQLHWQPQERARQ